jgi:tetratricopeptide (TPR) repeat protein
VRQTLDRSRLTRLFLTAFAITSAIALPVLVLIAISGFVPFAAQQKAILAFLIAVGICYAVLMPILLIGTPVCGAIFLRARAAGKKCTRSARGFLLGTSLLIPLGFAELTIGARRLWQQAAVISALSDAKLPEKLAEQNAEHTLTLAVVGESSAFGMPFENRLSVGKIVAWQLELALPAKRWNLEMVAEPGDTLRGQCAKLARLAFRPDAIIAYCGHNEFTVGIPWSRRVNHYVDDRPSLFGGFDELAGRVSPVCALIRETADKFRIGVTPHTEIQPVVDAPAYSPDEYASRLRDFRTRLEAIARFGQKVGAVVIFVVPPANDAGFDPNRSYLSPDTTSAGRAAFAHEFLAARSAENSSPAQAMELYRSLLKSQPTFAEAHYRLGRLLTNAGNWAEAYQQFVSARDLDGLPMRTLTSFQDAYREIAARHNCVLVDGQALFHSIAPHGLLDDHLFVDAVHPTLWGHVALAQAILDALHARRSFGWPIEANKPRIDAAICATHFGLTAEDWKDIAGRGSMFQYGTTLLRYDPAQRQAKTNAFQTAVTRLEAGEAPESVGLPNIGVRSNPPN